MEDIQDFKGIYAVTKEGKVWLKDNIDKVNSKLDEIYNKVDF